MNRMKINKIVDIFFDYLNENNNYSNLYKQILKDLMERIITNYESVGITEIYDEQEYLLKSPNNKYSVEDFFINRLLYNVAYLEIKDSGSRASWDPSCRTIYLNRNKISNLLKRNENNFTDAENRMAGIKVVMHEFEHALQTRYEVGVDIRYKSRPEILYSKLKENGFEDKLNKLYDGRKTPLDITIYTNYTSSGLKVPSDVYKPYKGTFWLSPNDKNYTSEDNLNEIFNESESLVMSGSKQKLKYVMHSGNCFPIMNYESSNYEITNYGFLLKILLGKKITFQGMYLNRDLLVNYFNQEYGEIFYKVFKEHFNKKYPNVPIKDAWSILNMIISEIKESPNGKYKEQCHLHLNYALSLCFDKKIKNDLETGQSYNECKQNWLDFKRYVVYNPVQEKNHDLPHIRVLLKLKEKIKAVEQGLSSSNYHNFQQENSTSTFNELEEDNLPRKHRR